MYPLISFVSLFVFMYLLGALFHSPKHEPGYFGLDGALIGITASSVSIWVFLSCPVRHWFAKILTLLILIATLFYSFVVVYSFLVHF